MSPTSDIAVKCAQCRTWTKITLHHACEPEDPCSYCAKTLETARCLYCQEEARQAPSTVAIT